MARILVVDDDRDVLRVIELRLERAGHEVKCASSAQTALEMFLHGESPDVVVLDVAMPDITGLEVLQTLRLGFGMKELPAIFLSALVSPEQIEAGRALGATYLTKPFVATALINAIDKAIESGRSR